MDNRPGYYKGCLELNALQIDLSRLCLINKQAQKKALDDAYIHNMKGARISEIEGPILENTAIIFDTSPSPSRPMREGMRRYVKHPI